jgi:hypothetical protein
MWSDGPGEITRPDARCTPRPAHAHAVFIQHTRGEGLSKREQLLKTLSEAESVLSCHGEEHWASWLRRDASLIQAGDGLGLEHLLSAFGGMGSFNDLILHPVNGHRIRDEETRPVNDRLGKLRSEIFELAEELRRSQE